ncbi:nuclear transport factor 2 family protein [Sorangium sp. So ce448]
MTDEHPAFEQAIRDVMERRARALVTRDLAELRLLLADDFSYVNSQGTLSGKAEYLTAVEGGRCAGARRPRRRSACAAMAKSPW